MSAAVLPLKGKQQCILGQNIKELMDTILPRLRGTLIKVRHSPTQETL
jgi:hypothetical protein